MADIRDGETIGEVLAAAVAMHASRPFLAIPANSSRDYLPDGLELTYAAADEHIQKLINVYAGAGYGLGHRAALLLDNHPEFVLHKLALTTLGVTCVPINPDYRSQEISYLVEHSEPDLVLVRAARERQISEALEQSALKPPVAISDFVTSRAPAARRPARRGRPSADTASSILYTSGTTGRPKGCVLSHGYEVASGARYASLGGAAQLRIAADRVYNPLPLFHVNAGILSLMGCILTGNCQIQPDRFHPQRWWREIVETRATVAHYLGVIAAMLDAQPRSEMERGHQLRFAVGAGIEPQLHAALETRFSIPFIELWGMTEMVRVTIDSIEPRQIGSRAFGSAFPGLEARVVDENDDEVRDGLPGEMVIRHSEATPRRGFFIGYLNDDEATTQAWRGGWFHTGDTVWRGSDGMLHFVDRKKNIIRRSGENIAAAEVEAVLLTHPDVLQAAVMAVKDELREEEVLACIVLKRPLAPTETAEALFTHCCERLAYFKAPGWVHFVSHLPTTGTQKIQKHMIFPGAGDPRALPDIIDMRGRKRRGI